jgi:hypothetical protein
MAGWIWNVQIGTPGREYKQKAGELGALYGALLGMQQIHIGYFKLTRGEGVLPEIGFENDDPSGPGDARAQWPDADYPQQMHLDIEVGDLAVAEGVALGLGASRLRDSGEYRVYADPVGHPFCLYLDPALSGRTAGPLPGRIARVVFDCFSPRALAHFYEEMLDWRTRVLDTPERVVIAGPPRSIQVTDWNGKSGMFDVTLDPREPMLAFQQVTQYRPPRWTDPAYPQQLHLDIGFDDPDAAAARIEELGGVCLRGSVWADPSAHPFCGPARMAEYRDGS